jgi:hypothetical protein
VNGLALQPLLSIGARCCAVRPDAWRLSIPYGPSGGYRVAQLDDYPRRGRRTFRWRAPLELRLRARVSSADFPGTWGFGFWNDPFGVYLGIGAERRVPTLPNAAWFFYASKENYLALSDHHPAHGLLAATFAAPHLPPALLIAGTPALLLLLWRWWARLMRRVGRWVVQDDAAALDIDPTTWHTYRLVWLPDRVAFHVDGGLAYASSTCPGGPLGFVTWIDNQYMAFTPGGRLRFGTLAGPAASLELTSLTIGIPDREVG